MSAAGDKYTYYKEYKSKGPICGFVIFLLIGIGCAATHAWAFSVDNKDRQLLAACMGIATAVSAVVAAWMACFNPRTTRIKVSKADGVIHVTYHSLCCGQSSERLEKISAV